MFFVKIMLECIYSIIKYLSDGVVMVVSSLISHILSRRGLLANAFLL